jgi:protein-disulfide isomerase
MEEENKKNDSITIKKDDLWKYSTVILAIIVVIGLISMFNGNGSSNTGTDPGNQLPTQPSAVEASVDDDAVLGDPNAPVTIIEFSDYQCPFCRKFWIETHPLLKEAYIDTGKAKLVFRDFPLTSIHPMAGPSGEAAECVRDVANSDEAYYEMHDKIFEEQNIIDSGNPNGPVTGTASYTNADLKAWAQELGYDISSCLDSGKFASEVQKDTADAQAAGGRGTPYFVINGQPLSGAQPFSAFRQVIESQL